MPDNQTDYIAPRPPREAENRKRPDYLRPACYHPVTGRRITLDDLIIAFLYAGKSLGTKWRAIYLSRKDEFDDRVDMLAVCRAWPPSKAKPREERP